MYGVTHALNSAGSFAIEKQFPNHFFRGGTTWLRNPTDFEPSKFKLNLGSLSAFMLEPD